MESKTYSTAHSRSLFSKEETWRDRVDQLLTNGERFLLLGNYSEAEKAFEEAESTAPFPYPELYLGQGLALFDFGAEKKDEEALLSACRKLKKANTIHPESTEILGAWGNALTLLGEWTEEHHFIISAKEKYEQALGLGEESADLFWDYGIACYHMGCHSGEGIDLQKALSSFDKAALLSDELPSEFWIDYGSTALLLATKLSGGIPYVSKAVNCFRQAVKTNDTCFDSWCSLAEALQMLYEHTHDEEHFLQANECFETASRIGPQDGDQWLEWSRFLCDAARSTMDVKKIRSSLEKCHLAHTCAPEHPLPLAIWAEALALLGQLSDRLDLIFEAENKIFSALELAEDDPAIWLSFGRVYASFAAYYGDSDYYYQAIEKFQQGISLDRTFDCLWHEIALTYTKVGSLEEEGETIEKSLHFFQRALSLKANSSRHIDYAKALSKIGELAHDKGRIEQAIHHFEVGLSMQKNAVYLHPDWLFSYGMALDAVGDFHDEEEYYTRAIELFSHVLMVDPEFPHLHHRLAQAFCHLGELSGNGDHFHRAVHHLRLALKREPESDVIILDWGVTLINISLHTQVLTDVEPLLQEAEHKITQAAKLGNQSAYYHLSCLYSILGEYDRSLYFLGKAERNSALPPIEDLMNDEWLEGLRSTSDFLEFLSERPHLKSN